MRLTGGGMSPERATLAPAVDISVVLCTWNRSSLLSGALAALVAQQDVPSHEILVVDNASTDGTAAVIAGYAGDAPALRYFYEPEQGLSRARNTGLRAARGRIIAFTDDDVRVPAGWLRALEQAFAAYPEADCAGGPVLPRWPGPVPRWLTERHWAPLGIQHYGDRPRQVDRDQPFCLIGANFAVRRDAFDRAGEFDPAVQRVGDGGGSTEDQEWQARLWAAGGHGVYAPSLHVDAVVTSDRLDKRHHRQWHFGHGRHVARMQLPEMERSRLRVGGIPVHLLRAAAADAAQWLRGAMRQDEARTFEREARLCFAAGYVRERWG